MRPRTWGRRAGRKRPRAQVRSAGSGSLVTDRPGIDGRPPLRHIHPFMSGIGVVLNPRSRRNLRDPRRRSSWRARSGTTASCGRSTRSRTSTAPPRTSGASTSTSSASAGATGRTTSPSPASSTSTRRRRSQAPRPSADRVPPRRDDEHRRELGRRPARDARRGSRAPHPRLRRAGDDAAGERRAARHAHRARRTRVRRRHYGFIFGTGVVYGYLAEYYRGRRAVARWSPRRRSPAASAARSSAAR